MREAWRGVGGLWGHVLGPGLQDATVTGRLHQSVCLHLLDTQGGWTEQQKRRTAQVNGGQRSSIKTHAFYLTGQFSDFVA